MIYLGIGIGVYIAMILLLLLLCHITEGWDDYGIPTTIFICVFWPIGLPWCWFQ